MSMPADKFEPRVSTRVSPTSAEKYCQNSAIFFLTSSAPSKLKLLPSNSSPTQFHDSSEKPKPFDSQI